MHPWILIINGGIAETQETEDLRKKDKEEKKEQEKKEKREKKEKKYLEKKEKKESKRQEEMKKKENREQDERVEEALMMEEMDEGIRDDKKIGDSEEKRDKIKNSSVSAEIQDIFGEVKMMGKLPLPENEEAQLEINRKDADTVKNLVEMKYLPKKRKIRPRTPEQRLLLRTYQTLILDGRGILSISNKTSPKTRTSELLSLLSV